MFLISTGVYPCRIFAVSCIVFVLNKRIAKWIDDNEIIGEEQAGFREDRNTSDHIFTLLALIQKQLLRHRKLYVAFIDFRKAFDTVCRTKLWNILYRNGPRGKIATALQSMYAIVKAQVRAGGELSDVFLCPRGSVSYTHLTLPTKLIV